MPTRKEQMQPRHLTSWRFHMGSGKAISMRQAAIKLGCNEITYARWERGETKIPVYVDYACTALVMGAPRWSDRTL